MNIKTVPIGSINSAEYNPRIIRDDEFNGLVASLKAFGQQENFIVNKDMTLISGHQRLMAAKQLKWKEVTVNVVDLSKHDEKKLNLLMNSRAIQGVFDELKLAEMLEELKLDDDYEALRLDALEPLDLSGVDFDKSDTSDEDTYLNQAIKQISLGYGLDEFEEIMQKVDALVQNGAYGQNPSEMFAILVREAYENSLS